MKAALSLSLYSSLERQGAGRKGSLVSEAMDVQLHFAEARALSNGQQKKLFKTINWKDKRKERSDGERERGRQSEREIKKKRTLTWISGPQKTTLYRQME